jgi:hypothetical protein
MDNELLMLLVRTRMSTFNGPPSRWAPVERLFFFFANPILDLKFNHLNAIPDGGR